MIHAFMYSTTSCPFCTRAEQLLRQHGIVVEKIHVDNDPEQLRNMVSRTGRRSVPQIYINDHHVGGYDDLVAWISAGRLQPLPKVG